MLRHLKVLSEQTALDLWITLRLAWPGEVMTVNLARLANVRPSVASHHLQKLLKVGLVERGKDGRCCLWKCNVLAMHKLFEQMLGKV